MAGKMKSKTRAVRKPAKKAVAAKSRGRKAAKPALLPADVIPGEVILGQGDIVAFQGRPTLDVVVANTGDRPIQVGSHCHFFEANRALKFDREKAFGFRLEVPAGTAVRFEPGEEKRVRLVAIGGNRVAYGINGLTSGSLDDPQVRQQAIAKAAALSFLKGTKA
jgi:urease beta subunit